MYFPTISFPMGEGTPKSVVNVVCCFPFISVVGSSSAIMLLKILMQLLGLKCGSAMPRPHSRLHVCNGQPLGWELSFSLDSLDPILGFSGFSASEAASAADTAALLPIVAISRIQYIEASVFNVCRKFAPLGWDYIFLLLAPSSAFCFVQIRLYIHIYINTYI